MPHRTSLDDVEGTPGAELFDGAEPRTVRLRLEADERVPDHTHPGRAVVFHLVSGRVDLRLDGEVYDLEAGEIVRFDGDRRVSPHAREPSTAVVVLAPIPGETDGAGG